jgi:hypothetical protein
MSVGNSEYNLSALRQKGPNNLRNTKGEEDEDGKIMFDDIRYSLIVRIDIFGTREMRRCLWKW